MENEEIILLFSMTRFPFEKKLFRKLIFIVE
jgi:hypothetical protein